MSQKIVIANWKMFKNFDETINFFNENLTTLEALTEKHSVSLCIAPSHLALAPIAKQLISSSIRLSSQDISAHESGPYTGQIDGRSLALLGVTYCLIGHSEIRQAYHLNNDEIALKVRAALNNTLIPVVCVGESLEEYESGQTNGVLKQQLEPIFKILHTMRYTGVWYIAYEPIWAINSGKSISPDDLSHVLDMIIETWPLQVTQAQFLYGGSVNSLTISSITQESRLSGFLVGKASTDLESLSQLIQNIS